ncbi:hypothetical protein AALO_G00159720 [Alosa alosa]|uniref:Uncharacterized protein n=1 Tax=Alosa alosa TaxID=278164 RepID=A0AAV6GHY7_9TELE|nr:hypothetical protein AALO_G00159720 [Alosa alosa]
MTSTNSERFLKRILVLRQHHSKCESLYDKMATMGKQESLCRIGIQTEGPKEQQKYVNALQRRNTACSQRTKSEDPGSATKKRTSKMKSQSKCDEMNSDVPDAASKTSCRKRRPWSQEEICAVEKTLMKFITTGRTPGKADCVFVSTQHLKHLSLRDWMSVKFYVKKSLCVLPKNHTDPFIAI